MTNKPTAEEVVRALRCHADADLLCGECSYEEGTSDCGRRMAADAADLIESTLARNAELEKQLTETQRQLRAAVEDLRKANFCSQCRLHKVGRCNGLNKRGKCADWEWCGPDAGEGEQ